MQSKAPSTSSSFAIDILKLVSGTTISQLIVVLAAPFLTRLYGPEAYGLLAIFTSITSIIGVIVCMRYELAIMLPKTDEEAANILGLCLLCVIVISGFTVPVLYFGGDLLLSVLKAPGLSPYLILIPPFVFISGIFLALNYWNSRTRHFGRLSIARVSSSIVTACTQLCAGFAGYATGGILIGASLVGSIVSTGVLGGQILRDDRIILRKNISWSGMLNGMKRYKKFPLIDSFSALLNTISWQLPIFLLSAFFSTTIVGFYSLGFTILQFPMSLIGSAIAQVFFQRAAEAYHQGTLDSLAENIFKVLLKLSVLPMLLIAVAGKDMFIIVFGAAWGEAGIYAQILSFWAIFWFISSPLSTICSVREKLTLSLSMTILNFITRLLSLVVGGVLGSAILAITLFSVSGVFVYGLACIVFLKLAGVPVRRTLRSISNSLMITIPFLIPLVIVKIFAFQSIVIVALALLMLIVYCIYILLTDSSLHNLLTGLRRNNLN